MATPTRDDALREIDSFLNEMLEKKLEPLRKKQDKIDPDSEAWHIIQNQIASLREEYAKPQWMERAATKMAKQLKFGTHISKGIHPDSKGENINFHPKHKLPDGVVGFKDVVSQDLDATGNAAALPLAAFFDIEIGDKKLSDLVLAKDPILQGVIDEDEAQSEDYLESFRQSLEGQSGPPSNHVRNKQVLWPDAVTSNDYHCLLPLHPSSLVHSVFSTINSVRFSEDHKSARENRKKKNVEQCSYVSVTSLGVVQLGGTKPQNISRLTSKQRGRNFLLESMPPPSLYRQRGFIIGKHQKSFFDKKLTRFCGRDLMDFYSVVKEPKSIVSVRDKRKLAMRRMLGLILNLAAFIQKNSPAGWSQTSYISKEQKYWLDPLRGTMDDQEDFKKARENPDWISAIGDDFSSWVNSNLRKKFPDIKNQFDDVEEKEWQREFERAVKESQREGRGIFI